jgi:hypothetical protein
MADVVGGLDNPPAYPKAASNREVRGDPDAVLAGLVRYVRTSIPHDETGRGRNSSLNWSAYRAGQHIAAGRLDADEVEAALCSVAVEVGLEEGEAMRTIASCMDAGMSTR